MNAKSSVKADLAAVDGRTGALASFPYDRMTVERFRKSIPSARWSDELKAWFVLERPPRSVLVAGWIASSPPRIRTRIFVGEMRTLSTRSFPST